MLLVRQISMVILVLKEFFTVFNLYGAIKRRIANQMFQKISFKTCAVGNVCFNRN